MKRILIVDDEENIGRSLRLILEREGYAVTICGSAAQFHAHPDVRRADAFLFDVRLPDGSGIDLLRAVRQGENGAPAIMISGHGTIADAVEATRAGAFDFLEKPLGRDKVLLALKNALEQANLRRENERLRELVGGAQQMIGSSAAFARAVEQATMSARSDARVLLIGESGTGKELLACHIHQQSPFAGGPFVKVNCAAIPTELLESELFGHEKGAFSGATAVRRGKFELADGGTLFLDEVADLHAASQAKLLRVLQEGEFQRVGGEQTLHVSVRVLSATNRDLSVLVELENAIERMAILTPGDRLTAESVPVEIRVPKESAARSTVHEARDSAERDHILRALEETNWNVSGAARALGMDRTNLHKRIRTLGLKR